MNSLTIDILTLFPEMFPGVLNSSILGKAQQKGLVHFNIVNFRQYATDKHHQVDDYPYGGGSGMVLKPEPIFLAAEDCLSRVETDEKPCIILLSPQGERYTQKKAEELAKKDYFMLICGHYEGVDERISQYLATDEISIGDYVLTGGELAAMVVIDSVVRLREGVLGNQSSPSEESFTTGLLEYPQYTRPANFRGMKVPEVLLSGHHQQIETWRREQALYRTFMRRPDLLRDDILSEQEKKLLDEWQQNKNRGKD
jgi:tRNA (guanine37-N1)-methyltransferase